MYGLGVNKLGYNKIKTDDYAELSFRPNLVASFINDYYRSNGAQTTSDSLITHSRASQATMVDSDGLIKWAPHNLLTYSEQFDNANWEKTNTTITANATVAPDGTTTADKVTVNSASASFVRDFLSIDAYTYTFGVFAKAGTTSSIQVYVIQQGVTAGTASVDLSDGTVSSVSAAWTGGVTATDVGDGWYFIKSTRTFTAAASNHGVGVAATGQNGLNFYIWGAHLYRSDLGGMVDNPATASSYVPTTSSALYLPRIGHHIYNGYEWVNEGVLHESEARTNLITYSNTLNDASFGGLNATVTTAYANSPFGADTATRLIDDGATGSNVVGWADVATVVSTSSVYTFWVFLKADQLSWAYLETRSFTTPGNVQTYFDLANGVVGTVGAGHTPHILDYGDGWYLCGITFTTDASDTSGQPRVYVAEADATTSVNRDGTSSILMAGWQFEAGSTPSSYIPTSGSSVTRAAESLTIPSANLPWPTPEYIGEELVTNGTFDTDVSDWGVAGSGLGIWAVVSGSVQCTGATSFSNYFYQPIACTVGKVYRLSIDVTAQGTTNTYVGIGEAPTNRETADAYFAENANGSYSCEFVATQATHYIVIQASAGTSDSIDNISVREINPLSLSIQMDGRMTYADDDVSNEVGHYRWLDTSSNRIVTEMSTAGTHTGRLAVIQTQNGTGDAVAEIGTGSFSPDINVPYNIASRHGSTFINGAIDGVALTANTTPTALPDLSSTDFQLGYDYMGTIGQLRIWNVDLGDTGIVAATEPSLEPSLLLEFDSSGTSFVDLGWSE